MANYPYNIGANLANYLLDQYFESSSFERCSRVVIPQLLTVQI